jgi:hypothetical protein
MVRPLSHLFSSKVPSIRSGKNNIWWGDLDYQYFSLLSSAKMPFGIVGWQESKEGEDRAVVYACPPALRRVLVERRFWKVETDEDSDLDDLEGENEFLDSCLLIHYERLMKITILTKCTAPSCGHWWHLSLSELPRVSPWSTTTITRSRAFPIGPFRVAVSGQAHVRESLW